MVFDALCDRHAKRGWRNLRLTGSFPAWWSMGGLDPHGVRAGQSADWFPNDQEFAEVGDLRPTNRRLFQRIMGGMLIMATPEMALRSAKLDGSRPARGGLE